MNITYFVSFFCDELLFIQPEFCAPITPNPNDVTETDRQTDPSQTHHNTTVPYQGRRLRGND